MNGTMAGRRAQFDAANDHPTAQHRISLFHIRRSTPGLYGTDTNTLYCLYAMTSKPVGSRPIGAAAPHWLAIIFAAAIIYQLLHWVEHLAPVYQHWWLGISLLQAHGIFSFGDRKQRFSPAHG